MSRYFLLLVVAVAGCEGSGATSTLLDSGVTNRDANAQDDASSTADGSVVDASADASSTAASAMIDETGGSVELDVLTLAVPQGALTTDTLVQVSIVDETPDVEGVTLLTPVFELGPDGAEFATELFVAFEIADLPEGETPIVFWTNEAGEYEARPAWWNDGVVHTITTHFSRAFVATSPSPPRRLRCRVPADITGERGICLFNEHIAMGSIGSAGPTELATSAVVVREAVGVTGELTIRETPVRPGALGVESKGSVVDIDGELDESGHVEVCLTATLNESEAMNACLGFFDEERSEWKCQDPCVSSGGGKVCGQTDHFTSFAVLLNPTGANSECERGGL